MYTRSRYLPKGDALSMSDVAAETVEVDVLLPGSEQDDGDIALYEDISPPTRWIGILEWFDEKVYILVGIAFLVAALFSLVYGLFYLGDSVLTTMYVPASGLSIQAIFTKEAGATDIIDLVSNLLLTLIIMEVLGTVVHHLRDGETTLRPFLFIGIISATRGILAVGARLSVSTTLSPDEFVRDMVELGVDAVVIIALGITMNLIGKYLEEGANPRRLRKREVGRGGRPALPQARTASVSAASGGLGVRSLFVLMALIILVALTLIGLLVSQGHF